MSVNLDCRQWWYFPIEMPLNAYGYGPAKVGEDAVEVTYEVWDRELSSHGSFKFLPDAINYAMKLNVEKT